MPASLQRQGFLQAGPLVLCTEWLLGPSRLGMRSPQVMFAGTPPECRTSAVLGSPSHRADRVINTDTGLSDTSPRERVLRRVQNVQNRGLTQFCIPELSSFVILLHVSSRQSSATGILKSTCPAPIGGTRKGCTKRELWRNVSLFLGSSETPKACP